MDVSSPEIDIKSSKSGFKAIEQTRDQLRVYKMHEQDLKDFESKQQYRELMESETDEEDFKKSNKHQSIIGAEKDYKELWAN